MRKRGTRSTATTTPGSTASETALRRRRRTVLGVSVAGAALLGASLSSEPGSWSFYPLTIGVAGTWIAGGLCSGPLARARVGEHPPGPIVAPVALGAGAFACFYGAALVARRVPFLNDALVTVMHYAHHGSGPVVLASALANAIGEEVFFRGAVYAAAGAQHPGATSTAAYVAVTAATRNPALVLASAAMGSLFALERRATGGLQAPILTHLTWSALMLRYLPPLFGDPAVRP